MEANLIQTTKFYFLFPVGLYQYQNAKTKTSFKSTQQQQQKTLNNCLKVQIFSKTHHNLLTVIIVKTKTEKHIIYF